MKNSALKKNLFFFAVISLVLVWMLWPPKPIQIDILKQVSIKENEGNEEKNFVVYVLDKNFQDIKVNTKEGYNKWLEEKRTEKLFFGLLKKKELIEPESLPELIKLPFVFKNNSSTDEQKIKIVQDLLTVPAGTNIEYIKEKKYQKLVDDLEIRNNKELNIELNKKDQTAIEKLKKTSSDKALELEIPVVEGQKIPLFVNNAYSPVQWPKYLDWSFFGYLWNVLIISISSFLYIFSTFFTSSSGFFLGNLGLGVILTTIFIRTLTWPIYTKTSTFSMNINLIQPEIEKVKQKYALNKDPASAQKMQLEILKVYRKNNFSFWGFLLSFLQLPLFIAINQTLTRFIIPGGIFKTDILIEKKFLGFISLNPAKEKDPLVLFLLSFLVGITMFILNKISFKKPDYLKPSTHHLTSEQKMKAKQSEKTMKIVSFVMIGMMVFFSSSNSILSLYWIVGNTYTIFQTLITRKHMEQKYLALKNNAL
ncbi:YidC/Oxa1 family membrane protein insertase [Candidatus Phytoplasma solani]|uniref:YidC/Oxa1 family membrane protein insertase n=1 Tax=Candidatus Phytoplasma solani TaxID=69896 RepID=UPI00358FFE67